MTSTVNLAAEARDLVADAAIYVFEDWLEQGIAAWVEPDPEPSDPREWAHASTFVTIDNRYTYREDENFLMEVNDFAAGYRRWDDKAPAGYDAWSTDHFAEWLARTQYGALAYTSFNFGNYGEALMFAYTTREHVQKACSPEQGASPSEVLAWLELDEEAEARRLLDSEVATFCMWDQGDVYGVCAEHVDGMVAAVWGVYVDSLHDPYLHELATDLIQEVT